MFLQQHPIHTDLSPFHLTHHLTLISIDFRPLHLHCSKKHPTITFRSSLDSPTKTNHLHTRTRQCSLSPLFQKSHSNRPHPYFQFFHYWIPKRIKNTRGNDTTLSLIPINPETQTLTPFYSQKGQIINIDTFNIIQKFSVPAIELFN